MLDKIQGTKADTVTMDDVYVYNYNWSKDYFAPSVGAQECPKAPANKNKKETDMRNYNTPVSLEVDVRSSKEDSLAAETREYLSDRLRHTFNNKDDDLCKTFFLHDDDAPKTPDEVLERIKAGLFVVPTKEEQKKSMNYYGNPWFGFTWRDPSKPADQDGYNKAHDKMSTARRLVKDAIMVKSAETALTELQAFEAMDFSK